MSFSPDKDIPSFAGKVILVTGGNSGLGKESILQLAKHNPRQIIMATRSQARSEAAIEEIKTAVPGSKITFLQLDLSSFDSIKKAAASILQDYDRLDVLLNNAGLMGVPPGLTEDASLPDSDVRIVQLSSEASQFAPKGGILCNKLKTPQATLSGRARYGQSKLANLYFLKALAKRYPHIKCVSLHPGIVNTGLATNTIKNYPLLGWIFGLVVKVFFTDVRTGALGQLWAATGPSEEIHTGAYYTPLKKRNRRNDKDDNEEMAEKLWHWIEQGLSSRGL